MPGTFKKTTNRYQEILRQCEQIKTGDVKILAYRNCKSFWLVKQYKNVRNLWRFFTSKHEQNVCPFYSPAYLGTLSDAKRT